MAYPTRLLAEGEEVVDESRPSWSVLTGPVLFFLLVIAGCTAVVVLFGSAPIAVGYGLVAVAFLALCWLVAKVIAWRARLLVVTNRRVIYRSGALRRTGREIPLARIQDVTYHQSLFERMLGTGSLLIESAGSHGQEPFSDIRRPERVQSLINQLASGPYPGPSSAHRARGPSRRPEDEKRSVPAPPPVSSRFVRADRDAPTGELPLVGREAAQPRPGEVTGSLWPARSEPAQFGNELRQQLRDLEELHQAGVLTDAEFDAKRRELLGF